jgi:hypothetical protein
MTAEYQKIYLIHDGSLGDMIRVVDLELVMGTQHVRMIKMKGKVESHYYATPNSGLDAIFHMIYLHMCMTEDAVNLLHRRIEAMAGGFISGPIVPKINDCRKRLQKRKTAKVECSYHELVRKCAMRLQSRCTTAYSITSKYIE